MGGTMTMRGERSRKLEALRDIIRSQGFTSFAEVRANGVLMMLEAFTVEPCEKCGRPAMNPNSIGFAGVDEKMLTDLGLEKMENFPAEVDVAGDGEYCCEYCNVNQDIDNAEGTEIDALKAKVVELQEAMKEMKEKFDEMKEALRGCVGWLDSEGVLADSNLEMLSKLSGYDPEKEE